MNKISKFIFLVLIATFLWSYSYGEEVNGKTSIPEDNLDYPVLIKLNDGSLASGFYLNDDDTRITYFITARHVLFEKNKNTNSFVLRSNRAVLVSYPSTLKTMEAVEIELRLDSINGKGNILFNFNDNDDVAIVKIGESSENSNFVVFVKGDVIPNKIPKGANFVGVNLKNTKKYADVFLSNEVIVFGYPTSLGIINQPQIEYDKPLLRKGIIAGKNDKKKTIILDCPIYYGNSGGPVVVVEVDEVGAFKKHFSVIGVVSEFIPFEEVWYNLKHKYTNSSIENSGYSVVVPMDVVFDLINKSKIKDS